MAVLQQENPLALGLERPPIAPTTLVIFGATGDLSRRKLLPGLYNLAHEGALPERFTLIGVARSDAGEQGYRQLAGEAIERFSRRPIDRAVLSALLDRISYVSGSLEETKTFEALLGAAETLERQYETAFNRVFYLATAPRLFEPVVAALGAVGLSRPERAESRVVIEKPFGRDLSSARALNRALLEVFDERQIYRIDHYLGKETVQNMLALRFANGIFEPLWNRRFIDNVQITAAEDIGIGTRADYYDSAGALRDIAQNHLLQLLTLLCMEPPVTLSAEEVRDEKAKVLRAIPPPMPEEVEEVAVRGQYVRGFVGGEEVPGYLDEQGVPPDSRTETYVALRLRVENWRWAGVPFYLRAGKRLERRNTEIAVTLRPVPHLAFEGADAAGAHPNQLILSVQPNEGISLSLVAKVPGARMQLRPVNMEFRYGSSFLSQSPEAYERLILDTMRADPTLFARGDEVEAAWAICDPILEAWASSNAMPPAPYEAGSAGPKAADRLLQGGARWRPI